MALGLASAGAIAQGSATTTDPRPPAQGRQMDLQQAFKSRSDWRLVVTEGPPTKDYGDNPAPGALRLCLHKGPSGPCVADPVTPMQPPPADGAPAWEPHYLRAARVVYPRGHEAAPFLQIVTGSLNAGNGDQVVAMQLLRYDADADAFVRIFNQRTGSNNNQEIRFIASGPLRGDVIRVEPTPDAPYAFRVVVDQLQADDRFRQVLRFRSATRYGDGNPLAVIDSEMPTILQKLGRWKPGQPLPVPPSVNGKPCLKPVLRHAELWCQ